MEYLLHKMSRLFFSMSKYNRSLEYFLLSPIEFQNYILNLTQRNEDIVGVSFGGFKAKTSNIESIVINILPKLQFMEVFVVMHLLNTVCQHSILNISLAYGTHFHLVSHCMGAFSNCKQFLGTSQYFQDVE